VYDYPTIYYEYDCATEAAILTVEPYAYSSSKANYVVTTVGIVQQSKPAGSAATAVAETAAGSGSTYIYNYGSNDCGDNSNCGQGNNNGGSNNNNGKSGASASTTPAMSVLRLLSGVYLFLLAWFG
jgi:hypothetical protein